MIYTYNYILHKYLHYINLHYIRYMLQYHNTSQNGITVDLFTT